MSTSKMVSICIACHNQGHLVGEAITSCISQDYDNKEIILLDDASTDNTYVYKDHHMVRYFRSDTPSGTGGSFNKAISQAIGDIIVLLCADDVFTDRNVIADIVKLFEEDPKVGHVTRFYHQFIDGDRRPVRAWRTYDPIEQANNPSGLAFRRAALFWPKPFDNQKMRNELSNNMFVEASTLVHEVLDDLIWSYDILEYDTVAVRIHQSISQSKDYYKKRWNSSPIEEWAGVGGKSLLTDFTSLIQIKNNFVTSAVLKECWNFIRLKRSNLLRPDFWFFALVAILTPRPLLRKIPHWYRITWGRWTTREVKREQAI